MTAFFSSSFIWQSALANKARAVEVDIQVMRRHDEQRLLGKIVLTRCVLPILAEEQE